jgi:RNA polymerase sigma-70 factor (ECF subfamily)
MSHELVAKARAGDVEAFDRLVARYQDAVSGLAFGLVGNFEDAQEIAQETFIQAWRDLRDLRDVGRFAAWLSRITRNRCHDFLRNRKGQPAGTPPEARLEAQAVDPAEQAARSELRQRVLTAIRDLSEPNRLATTLFYIDGYSIPEVAEFLGTPVGTVKRRLHESRKRLKRSMMAMLRESLGAEKPGPELRATVAAELQARKARWDEMLRCVRDGDDEQWAGWWHDRRMEDVRANAAQYGIEPDEDLPRMLPAYWQCDTFRDDTKDMPRRWGIPEGLGLAHLRDLSRELSVSPLSIHRWEQDGLPSIRYHPWVVYDRARVMDWLGARRREPVLAMDADQARKPFLTVLGAVASGVGTVEEGEEIHDKLETVLLFRGGDPLWDEEWRSGRQRERLENAALYGLDEPTDSWLGIPQDRIRHQFEIRDLTRRIEVCPIDVVRWTHDGLPCLRRSPLARWDIQYVTDWLVERGIVPRRATIKELDVTERYVCRAVAAGEATPQEGHEALAGRLGLM